jgi:hypothetical protein
VPDDVSAQPQASWLLALAWMNALHFGQVFEGKAGFFAIAYVSREKVVSKWIYAFLTVGQREFTEPLGCQIVGGWLIDILKALFVGSRACISCCRG